MRDLTPGVHPRGGACVSCPIEAAVRRVGFPRSCAHAQVSPTGVHAPTVLCSPCSPSCPRRAVTQLELRGGTDADMAPPAAYLTHVLLPLLGRAFGELVVGAEVQLVGCGCGWCGSEKGGVAWAVDTVRTADYCPGLLKVPAGAWLGNAPFTSARGGTSLGHRARRHLRSFRVFSQPGTALCPKRFRLHSGSTRIVACRPTNGLPTTLQRQHRYTCPDTFRSYSARLPPVDMLSRLPPGTPRVLPP